MPFRTTVIQRWNTFFRFKMLALDTANTLTVTVLLTHFDFLKMLDIQFLKWDHSGRYHELTCQEATGRIQKVLMYLPTWRDTSRELLLITTTVWQHLLVLLVKTITHWDKIWWCNRNGLPRFAKVQNVPLRFSYLFVFTHLDFCKNNS